MSDNDNGFPVFAPVKAGSLRARVAESLREAIFSGRLKPGDPIREAHLAKAMKVSQPTVREALMELEHAGLVVRNPQRDTLVTRLTPDDIRERTRLRVLLEPEAAMAALARMDDAGFRELEHRLYLIHEGLARDSYMDYAAADLEFHRAIWRMSGNKLLYKLLELTTVPLFAFFSIQRSRVLKDLAQVVHSHDPIMSALRSGDEARIREAFQQHLEGSYAPFTAQAQG